MPVLFDPSHDFLQIIDFLGNATLKVDGEEDVALESCVFHTPQTWKELEPTGGQVLLQGMLFVWPQDKSTRPPIGSVIVDEDDQYWTIWKFRRNPHVETWEAQCLNLSIVTAPANQATLLKAVYGKGNANEAMATWVGAISGQTPPTAEDIVPARFQPSDDAAALLYGAEFLKNGYRVFFEQNVPLKTSGAEYRLKDASGASYRVLRYNNAELIDRMPVAMCMKIVEGGPYWEWAVGN